MCIRDSIMPPFGDVSADTHNLDDEVYFYFRGSDEFKEMLRMFAAANAQADISEGKDKDAYLCLLYTSSGRQT